MLIRNRYVTAYLSFVQSEASKLIVMRRFQIFGHQRQGSDSAAFKELTKRDAQTQLAVELEKLLRTCPDTNKEVHLILSLSLVSRIYLKRMIFFIECRKAVQRI